MRLFKLIEMSYQGFANSVSSYLSKTLSNLKIGVGSNTIFGQLITVVVSTTQNMFAYIEDALTEQNKYTASRKRSIYGMAAFAGYKPSLGTATSACLKLAFKPNTMNNTGIILNNHTKLMCDQNGLIYNIILPQEAIVLSVDKDKSTKYLTVVEGKFESQQFLASGGQLYTRNIIFNGDADLDYTRVFVNEEEWTRQDSLYDMSPDGKEYCIMPSLKHGVDVIFGNDEFGRALKVNDVVRVEYLLHGGEEGNIDPNKECKWTWETPVQDTLGNDIDPNSVFDISLEQKENVNSGTNSEDYRQVANMIGYNSRALVLADAKNYKLFLSRYSFVGYNRTWSERGSLVTNAIILKNYASQLNDGKDYFDLSENDFFLNNNQKQSILNAISESGQQLAGTVLNIFDPELMKYAMYMYIKPKSGAVINKEYLTTQIRNLVGNFFANLNNDMFVPKSDITKLIKDNIDSIDGVDVYFISERNETALKNKYYIDRQYVYNPATGTYDTHEETVYLYNDENPGLGLDAHGNIYLENSEQFPVLMKGWSYYSSTANREKTEITVSDPLTIVFE